jgi:predicted MFS family arabinose efflux permease
VPLSLLGWISGSYTGAAALVGLLAARFLDRFDRRSALAVTLLGLVIGTACGGLATGIGSLMAARVVAGAFGGPATALSLSVIADVIPPARRGRALGVVMGAFSVASVLGLPAALELSRLGGWRATFFSVAALGLLVTIATIVAMPALRLHMQPEQPTEAERRIPDARPPTWSQRWREHRPTVMALAATFSVMIAAFSIVPNMSAFVQGNLHYPRTQLGVLYLAGGVASFIAVRLMGPLIDRFGAAFTAWIGTILFVTLVGSAFVAEWPLPTLLIYVGFMTGMALRNMSLSALSTRVPRSHERARFMSLQSAVQHSAASLGAVISAQLLHERPDRSLAGMPKVGSLSIALAFALPLLLRAIEQSVRTREAQSIESALAAHPLEADAIEPSL